MKFLLSPGYTNSGPDHWQTHLQNTFDSFERIHHHNWDFVERERWIEEVEKAISLIDEDIVLIGHSCGTNAIVQWSQENSSHLGKIKAAILVAPADVENEGLSLEIRAQRPMPSGKIPFPSLVIGSNNDPFITLDSLQTLSEAWGAELVIIPDAGHIASDDGYGRWPQIIDYIEEFTKISLQMKQI